MQALAVKFVYWPERRCDNTAHDAGGVLFEICEWSRMLSPEGKTRWNVKFRRGIKVSGIINELFKNHEIAIAKEVEERFDRQNTMDVEGAIAETEGQPYLTMKGAKEAMARFYGIDIASIMVTLQQ